MGIGKQRQTLKHLSSYFHRLNFTTNSFSPSFLVSLYYFIPSISPLTLLSQLVSLGPTSEAISRTGGLGQPVVIFLCYSSFLILFLRGGVALPKASVPSGNACSSMVSSMSSGPHREAPPLAWLLHGPQGVPAHTWSTSYSPALLLFPCSLCCSFCSRLLSLSGVFCPPFPRLPPRQGAAILAAGPGHALRWGHWSQLGLAWDSPSIASLSGPTAPRWAPDPGTAPR